MTADDATPPLVAAPPVPPVVPDSAGKTWEEVTSVYGIGSPESMEAFRKSREASGSGVVPDKPALAEAVRDVLWRAQRYGETADGDTAHYIVTKGAMHRLMGAAQAVGIPASFRNDDSIEVPDKPALAPDGRPASMFRQTDFSIDDDMSEVTFFVPVVPAVTDDEAATKALAVALHDPDECRQCMVRKAGGHCVAWNGTLLRSASIISALRSAGFLIVHHTKET